MPKPLLFLISALLFGACDGLRKPHVDLIIHNATIYTLDDAFTTAEAMAIRGDSIVDIGAEHEIMNRYQSVNTLDARQAFVYPGFIDGHAHLYNYAVSLGTANLFGTKSWDECVQRLEDFAPSNQSSWLTGRGWDQNDWHVANFPHRLALDTLFPNTPVALTRIDGHAVVVNQKALEIAGLLNDTIIQGGIIVKDDNGAPTGVLIDKAADYLKSLIPAPDKEILTKLFRRAQDSLLAYGITSIVEAGLRKDQVELFEELCADSILKTRVYAMLSSNQENFDHYLKVGPSFDKDLTIASFKFYADGALGSRGAALLEPYSDHPHEQGLFLEDASFYRLWAEELYEGGWQMNTHCIGDSANRFILDLYGDVLGGTNDRRWRIEHAQVVHSDDLKKYRDYTIIPSIQPTHATSDMYWAESRLGERIHRAYSYRSLLEQNQILALGTDFPIEHISPINTFYAAVFRVDHDGYPEGGFRNDERLHRKDALRGMTIWNALATFSEEDKGSIEVGKLADLVVLNVDLMNAEQMDIHRAHVQTTIIDGRICYQRK